MTILREFGDMLACGAVRLSIGTLNLLPLAARLKLASSIVRLVVLVIPRFGRAARRNLEFVFPQISQADRRALIDKSCASLARVFVDFARLPALDRRWMEQHVACPFFPRLVELKRENPSKGLLIATGHLGSFELLAHYTAIMGYPLSFVVRDFKLQRLNRWWRSIREARGNRVISRKGAFEEVLSDLRAGRDVALLFDQNVTRNHAVFVDWFGRPAATTRALALAAIRTEARILVAGILHEQGDYYRIETIERDFSAVYSNTKMSLDQKIAEITSTISNDYQKMIMQKPEAWFWMHRRWKTAANGVAEDFYA